MSGRKYGPHRDMIGQMGVGHRAHRIKDVRLRSDHTKLPLCCVIDVFGPDVHAHTLPTVRARTPTAYRGRLRRR